MKTAREIIKTAMYSCGIEKNVIDQALAELRKLIKEQRPEDASLDLEVGCPASEVFNKALKEYDGVIDEVMK